jgi:glutamyl-tRNA reductase
VAERVGGNAIHFDQLYDTANQADIVITSTGAPHAIFRREHGERFMQRRKNRPMFFIDIAVPRDVDADMSHVDGIFVYDIDDLQQVVEANVSDRGREAERAELLIEEEVARFRRRLQNLDAVPTIIALQNRMEQIRQAELERLRAKFGNLSAEQHAAIDNLTRSIVNKIVHPPIAALKSVSGSEQLLATAEFLRNLFGIEDEITRRNGAAAEKTERIPTNTAADRQQSERSSDQETGIEAQKSR